MIDFFILYNSIRITAFVLYDIINFVLYNIITFILYGIINFALYDIIECFKDVKRAKTTSSRRRKHIII